MEWLTNAWLIFCAYDSWGQWLVELQMCDAKPRYCNSEARMFRPRSQLTPNSPCFWQPTYAIYQLCQYFNTITFACLKLIDIKFPAVEEQQGNQFDSLVMQWFGIDEGPHEPMRSALNEICKNQYGLESPQADLVALDLVVPIKISPDAKYVTEIESHSWELLFFSCLVRCLKEEFSSTPSIVPRFMWLKQ